MRRIIVVLIACILLSVLVDFLLSLGRGEPHNWWGYIWGFFGLLGFIGVLVISGFSRFVGRYIIERREDYYE